MDTQRLRDLQLHPRWQHWMEPWCYYSDDDGEYIGTAPDCAVVAQHHDVNVFVDLFIEGATEWSEVNG